MADTKISALTALTGANSAKDDIFPVVDISVGAADGANKTMTRDELALGLGLNITDYLATRYYWPRGYTPNTAAANGLDTIRFLPIIGLKRRLTISELGFRIGTGSAATNCQLALYAADKTEGNPTGSALASTANQATTASSTNISVAFSGAATVTLEPGEGVCAWMAFNCSSATPTFITAGAHATSPYLNIVGTTSLANMLTSTTNIMNSLSLAQTFGTWPDVTASGFTEVNTSACPFMFYKVSAVG